MIVLSYFHAVNERAANQTGDGAMFKVEVDKYSHSGSGFSRVDSVWPTREEAVAEADRVHAAGYQRFVYVSDDKNREVYNPAIPVARTMEIEPDPAFVELCKGFSRK